MYQLKKKNGTKRDFSVPTSTWTWSLVLLSECDGACLVSAGEFWAAGGQDGRRHLISSSVGIQKVDVNISKWTMLSKAQPNCTSTSYYWCAFVIAFCISAFCLATLQFLLATLSILLYCHPFSVLATLLSGKEWQIRSQKFYTADSSERECFFLSYEWKAVYM